MPDLSDKAYLLVRNRDNEMRGRAARLVCRAQRCRLACGVPNAAQPERAVIPPRAAAVCNSTTPADRATQLIELQQQYDQEHTARLNAEKASFSVRRPATDTIDSLAVQMPSVAERVAEQQNVRRGSVASVDSAYDTTGLALFETGSLEV